MFALLLACTSVEDEPRPSRRETVDSVLDSVADTSPPTVCSGAAQVADTPLSPNIDGLAERWDQNKELLRILFIGSPT